MKNIALAVAFACALGVSRASAQAVGPTVNPQAGSYAQSVIPTNLDLLGAAVYRVEDSTVAALAYSGPGKLYELSVSSGVSTAFCVAFDSASATGITVTTKGEALTPNVYTSGVSTTTLPLSSGAVGFYNPRVPAHFTNGLVLICSDTETQTGTESVRSLVKYCSDQGNNPCP